MDNCRNSIVLERDSRNNRVYNNSVKDASWAGLLTYNSRDNQIFNNIIDNNCRRGIYLDSGSENNTVFLNTIINNLDGIEIKSDNNTIENNTIDNNFQAIEMVSCLDNRISNNNITYCNQIAVSLTQSNRTIFKYNRIINNSDIGVLVEARNNTFYGNEFINKVKKAIKNFKNKIKKPVKKR
jgi:parallel beta-helix repeat protein